MMFKNKKKLIAFLLLVQVGLIKLLSYFPEFVETYYSNGLYQWISKLMHYSFGWLPFSVGDLFYTIATIYSIRWLIINRKRIIKDTKNWLVDVFATISIAYFAFHILWAFNYYRLPLHDSLNIDNEYSTEELINFTKRLISKTNEAHRLISNNDTLKVDFPYTKKELLNLAPKGYEELSKKYPQFAYHPKSIKKSIYSLQLTYMGFSGYLNPFTNEAQIDGLIPKYKYPTTASHEVAHQIGYAAESEANFIGFMATIHHKNKYFNYSGYAFALRYCLSEIYKRNLETYEELLATINKGVLKNYKETRDFWESYKNPLEPLFKTSYNGFLKANSQDKGIKSYSYIVALLVNYFEENSL